MADSECDIAWSEKLDALIRVGRYRPAFTSIIIGLGGIVAVLEGVGLSFIYPIMEVAQAEGTVEAQDPIMEAFLLLFEFLGLPFSLGVLIIGISLVMVVRFVSSFFVAWLKAILRGNYEEMLRRRAFDAALNAEVSYFDDEGSDDILNAIIT